ncbi:hypothetical protein [Methylobrevis albus]|uniref:Uncharacterized protein n=1 Tax=Methylobrevis albus TaxID=2793297 RepID=A0A931MXF0_9HYPH|nr:hypothetical protein [Methylobrevis albus]MBH0238943.1 hypothetical protein [Methylobrevis albus]
MNVPTFVSYFTREVINVDEVDGEIKIALEERGFRRNENYRNLFAIEPASEIEAAQILGFLRDIGIPFATDRSGGAGPLIEWWKKNGLVRGEFIVMDTYIDDIKRGIPPQFRKV